jgi:hypothetical protein
MAAQALAVEPGYVAPGKPEGGQIPLYEEGAPVRARRVARVPEPAARPCAGCRAREARYGFQGEHGLERARTLCFECFRMELDRRQRVAAQLARGWNAEQARLPLADTLNELSLRRRRAQIAARHAIGA